MQYISLVDARAMTSVTVMNDNQVRMVHTTTHKTCKVVKDAAGVATDKSETCLHTTVLNFTDVSRAELLQLAAASVLIRARVKYDFKGTDEPEKLPTEIMVKDMISRGKSDPLTEVEKLRAKLAAAEQKAIDAGLM